MFPKLIDGITGQINPIVPKDTRATAIQLYQLPKSESGFQGFEVRNNSIILLDVIQNLTPIIKPDKKFEILTCFNYLDSRYHSYSNGGRFCNFFHKNVAPIKLLCQFKKKAFILSYTINFSHTIAPTNSQLGSWMMNAD